MNEGKSKACILTLCHEVWVEYHIFGFRHF